MLFILYYQSMHAYSKSKTNIKIIEKTIISKYASLTFRSLFVLSIPESVNNLTASIFRSSGSQEHSIKKYV